MRRIHIAVVFLGFYLLSGITLVQPECENCGCCDIGKNTCGTKECTSCSDGHWGGRCYNKCPAECLACAKEPVYDPNLLPYLKTLYHVCTKCVDGKYLGNTEQNMTCKLSCPKECTSCTSLENCTSCKTGYYHENGRCTSCPEQNMTCKLSCPKECTTCTSLENCTSCETGYYHEKGRCIQCSVGCVGGACDNTTGACSCKTEFSGEKCDDCADTYYGQNCIKCPNVCLKQMCEKDSGDCKECPANITGNSCENCVPGVYGNTCNISCPKNCRDNICHRNTGNCFNCTGDFLGDKCNRCKPGKFGTDCTLSCHPNCKDHICIKDSGHCINCSDGFSGPTCDQCSVGLYSSNCSLYCLSPNCNGHVCNRDSGLCEHNGLCAEGWYGNSCYNRCSNGCKFENCSRENGVCFNGCKDNYSGDKCCVYNKNCLECSSALECLSCVNGFYGEECQFNCSINCIGGCVKVSGECNGCKIDSFGAFCNLTCSDSCKLNEDYPRCNESNGNCLFGCGDGFYGSTCKDKCINTCTDNKCDRQQGTCLATTAMKSIVAPAAGGLAGVAVVFVVAVVVILINRKRRTFSKLDSSHRGFANTCDLETSFPVTKEVSDENASSSTSGHLRKKKSTVSQRKSEEADAAKLDESDEEIAGNQGDVVEYQNASNKDAPDNVAVDTKVSELYEYVRTKTREQYNKEFKLLPRGLQKPHKAAQKSSNRIKNRYAGIYPYDETRVTIENDPDFFINANYIKGYGKEKGYIASLGPTKEATEDFKTFWRMVWNEKSDVVVMLTNLQEITGMKCDQYWPDLEKRVVYGKITVTCRGEEVFAEYIKRTFSVSYKKEKRTLTQLQFTAWPDKSVPDSVVSLTEFWQKVKNCARPNGGPDIVHCSAGIGRTGAFIAIDKLTQKGKAEGSVNVYDCILDLREQRVGMVQTLDQFIYVHKALVYTLVLESEAISSETFQEHVESSGSAVFAHYFQLLHKTVEDENDAEREAKTRNAKYKGKNRPGADIPGYLNRPRIHFNKSFNDPDYINATFIDGLKRKNAFIVAQTPLPSTLEDFVTLLYQEECACVVSHEEEPHNRKDVGVYLPADNQPLTVGPFTLTSTRCESKLQYLVRKLSIEFYRKPKETKTMYHFQYIGWPKGENHPEDPKQFLQFINDVKWKAAAASSAGDSKPILVHCLDAYSRSGLFCVVAVAIEKLQVVGQVSIPNTIRQIRTRRHGAITNKEQFEFCYRCAASGFDNFTYTNFVP